MTHGETAAKLQQLKIDRSEQSDGSGVGLRGLLLIGALLVIAAVVWVWWQRSEPQPVEIALARAIADSGANASVLDAAGYVVARRMATVSAKITGKVLEVNIEEGQRVDAGEVMARLDPVDAQAQYDLAAAQRAAARSQIDSLGAQLREAEAHLQRLQTLIARQLAAASQLDAAVAQRDALRAQKRTAERTAEVADQSLAIAQIGLDNTVVRAPFAGVVIAKAAQPGEIVSPLSAGGGFTRTGIGTVVDMDSLEVEVDVNEAFIGRVRPGMPVQATLNAYAEWKIPAEVIAIIPAADRGKATVRVRIALKEKDSRIVPDMGVRVSFLEQPAAGQATTDAAPQGVLVPAAAIVRRDGKAIAFTLEDGRAQAHHIELGRSLGDDREVIRGLAAGQRVILNPPATLGDGTPVQNAGVSQR